MDWSRFATEQLAPVAALKNGASCSVNITKGIDMELRDYINLGIVEYGTVSALADELGLQRESLSAAKSHRRGIPAYAIAKLSEILEVDPRVIMAASELVTERNNEKREYWLPFVENTLNMGRLAKLVVILGIVTNLMTPQPAEAAQNRDLRTGTICIMLSRKLFSCLSGFFKKYRIFFAVHPKTIRSSLGMAV